MSKEYYQKRAEERKTSGYYRSEEYKQKQKEYRERRNKTLEGKLLMKKWSDNSYQKKIQLIEKAWGKSCFFCGRDKVRIIHRKDGNPHKLLTNMSLTNIRKTINENKNEYVRVCGICHKSVHWIMEYLKLTWEEILNHQNLFI